MEEIGDQKLKGRTGIIASNGVFSRKPPPVLPLKGFLLSNLLSNSRHIMIKGSSIVHYLPKLNGKPLDMYIP